MASYTTNSRGQRQYKPGTSVTTSTNGLQSSIDAARGILSILYEASKGGEPLVPRSVSSSGEMRSILPEPYATLWSKLLFSPGKPSSSPNRTIGGASKVVLCRVNPATQASVSLVASAVAELTIKAADWGLFGNEIQVKVDTDPTGTKKRFSALYGSETFYVDGGILPIMSLIYTAPALLPPTNWTMTGATPTCLIAPTAADGSPGVLVSYSFVAAAVAAGTTIDPSTWMSFDGIVSVTIGAQDAGVSRVFVFSGTNKENGSAYTESLTVDSNSNASTSTTWSEITEINMPTVLDGDATYTGPAFSLPMNTSGGVAQYSTISSVIDRINQKTARGFTARALSARDTFVVEDMDGTTATSIADIATFSAKLFDLMEKINANIDIVEAERPATGVALPDNSAYTNLAGGGDGATDNADWTDALAAIETEEINEVVPWTTSSSINALVLDHCNNMTLLGKGERSCSLSVPISTARGTGADQLYELSLAVNSRLATMHCQGLVMYNESGVRTTYDPRATSLLISSLAAGRNPLYGVTWAMTNGVLDLVEKPGTDVTDWSAQLNAEELIQNGYELIEKTKVGFRVLRGNTSYMGTEPQYSSRLAVETTLLATKTLREGVEAVVGQSTVIPIKVVQELIVSILDRLVTSKIIVAWNVASLVLTPVAGEKVKVDVVITVAVERLWVDIALGLVV